MDSKTIIYIVLGIAWYIFKYYKKNKKANENPQQPAYENYDEQEVIEEPQNENFGDLFEQLLNPQPQVEKEIEIKRTPTPTPYVNKQTENRIKKIQEEEKSKMEFERFDKFKIQKEVQKDYSEMFETPQSVEEAFVASEIFTRKF